jgi:hypothetical protein
MFDASRWRRAFMVCGFADRVHQEPCIECQVPINVHLLPTVSQPPFHRPDRSTVEGYVPPRQWLDVCGWPAGDSCSQASTEIPTAEKDRSKMMLYVPMIAWLCDTPMEQIGPSQPPIYPNRGGKIVASAGVDQPLVVYVGTR